MNRQVGPADRYAGETTAPVAALGSNPHRPRLRHGQSASPRAPSISPPSPSPTLCSSRLHPQRGSPDSARFQFGRRLGSRRGVAAVIPQDSQPMAAAAADSADPAVATSTCAHCNREVPTPNMALHSAHCARNLHVKCEHCGDMVPRKHMDRHYDDNHAPMNCPRCEQTVEHELWDLHKRLRCPQRMLACQYCKFELPAADIFEHQDVCGNRTKYCQPCNKDIRLREWIGHELLLHSKTNAAAESSSDRSMLEKEEGGCHKQVRPAFGLNHKQLLLTIAITGLAVLIGSILFQRRIGSSEAQ